MKKIPSKSDEKLKSTRHGKVPFLAPLTPLFLQKWLPITKFHCHVIFVLVRINI